MYQNKDYSPENSYLLNLQFYLLIALAVTLVAKGWGMMLVQFIPDAAIIMSSIILGLSLVNSPKPKAIIQKLKIAWRCRGEVMHGAHLPVRLITPQL